MSIRSMALRPIGAIARQMLTSPTHPTRVYGGRARGLLLPPEIATKYLRMVLGNYETDMQAVFAAHCHPGMVAYDLGAHVGFMTLLLGRLVSPGGRVHAFEPSAKEAAVVDKAVKLNHFDDVITVHRMAMCDEVGELPFGSASFTGILGKAVENKAGGNMKEAVTVPSTTLDHFVYSQGNQPPDFMKVDVESAEPLVMAGARELLSKKRPTILVELHGPTACHDTLHALLEHGYRLTWLQAPREKSIVTFAGQLREAFSRGRWTQHVLAIPAER